MFSFLARIATTRSRLVLALTGLGIVLAAVAGIHATSKLKSGGFVSPNAPSQIASNRLDAYFVGPPDIILLVQARSGSVDAPSVASVGRSVAARLAAARGVEGVASYWATGDPGLKNRAGTEALVVGHIAGSDSTVEKRAKALTSELSERSPVAVVSAGGGSVAFHDIGTQIKKDLAVAESIAIPLTMILLVIAFGSVVAASLPVLIGLISIVTTLAVLFLVGSITNVSQYALNLTTAMSLGLAIDYSLLMVNRFREEMGAGYTTAEAISRSLEAAGRTILVSAATVAAAMAALLVFPVYFLRSMAYAGISVVLLATIGALVVLPALLNLLGTRVNALPVRLRRVRRGGAGSGSVSGQRSGAESPFWRRFATFVMRRPLATGLPVVLVLLIVAVPFTHVSFGSPDDRVLAPGSAGRLVGDALRTQFAGNANTATSIVTSRTLSDAQASRYAHEISALPGVGTVFGPSGVWVGGARVAINAAQAASLVRYQSAHGSWFQANTPDPLSHSAQALVRTMRAVPVPGGGHSYIGGEAASLVDQKHDLGTRLPLALVLIVLTTFIVLWLFTGSVVLPIKALFLNALTLSSVLGIAVWVFQYGHLSGLLDFTPGPTSTTMPLLLFCIAFGLSMDYEVFVLSRIKELHDAGMPNNEAVVGGLARSGRIVTTAAALMSVTFFAFAISKVSFIQMFAIGTGTAVLIDSTLIRGVLVPAFMRLVGEANWWSPRPLRILHERIGLSDVVGPVAEPRPQRVAVGS
jgi:putative drug exporter of the RND superfamily